MRATFHPKALDELFDALGYYDRQSKGLGDKLYADIDATVVKIEEHPERWPYYMGRFRRCRADDFPYKVIYEILDSGPFIVAVMHDKRDPEYWLDRVNLEAT